MGSDNKNPLKPAEKSVENIEDDIAQADELAKHLNALAEESENTLKPKTLDKQASKWDSLDEAEDAAAMNANTDDDSWF